MQPAEFLLRDNVSDPIFRMEPDDLARRTTLPALAGNGAEPLIDWQRFVGPAASFVLTARGREAIDLALADLSLQGDDEVLIVTTSGSPYISACVTEHISRRCRWSRQLSGRTKSIFVIHEFGFPARLPVELLDRGLPIIEDCAYAFGSQNAEGNVGNLGDYVIYSLPKAVPVPYGGLLKCRYPLECRATVTPAMQRGLNWRLAHYLPRLGKALVRRREVFEAYRRGFAAHGQHPLFEPGPAVVPHAFVLALPDQALAERMKPRLTAAGILSSVFYGGGGYYLPNHQSLSDAAIRFIVATVLAALREA